MPEPTQAEPAGGSHFSSIPLIRKAATPRQLQRELQSPLRGQDVTGPTH